jgi:exodeoxyribonuclease-5
MMAIETRPKFEPTPQQAAALEQIRLWLADRERRPVFRLFGYAGTGKTTLAEHIAAHFAGQVYFLAYTGKAALRLQQKQCPGAMTIHAYLYDMVGERQRQEKGHTLFEPVFAAKPMQRAFDFSGGRDLVMAGGDELLIIDECSMINATIGADLLARGRPIVVIGDPFQLPPVEGAGYFTHSKDYPTDTPDVRLTDIIRQKAGSKIIRLATAVREGRPIPDGVYDTVTVETCRGFDNAVVDLATYDHNMQVICGTHRTRIAFNRRVRKALGLGALPMPGDRVICYRNHNERDEDGNKVPIFMNGEVFRVLACRDLRGDYVDMSVVNEVTKEEHSFYSWKRPFLGETWEEARMSTVPGNVRYRAQEFDYAWAITCHKAQGSEWNHVVVFDEANAFREHPLNWRYTAVTRAAETLRLIREAR